MYVAAIGLILIVVVVRFALWDRISNTSTGETAAGSSKVETEQVVESIRASQSGTDTITPQATASITPTLAPTAEAIQVSPEAVVSLPATITPNPGEIQLRSLDIELWPEYDRTSVLVIYRIMLDPRLSLPVEFSIRIPARAGKPFAVAERPVNGIFVDLKFSEQVGNEWSTITLEASSPEVQVEYYDPGLKMEEDIRHFEYTWPGGLLVEALKIRIQQPWDAQDLIISPESGWQKEEDKDKLVYHTLEAGALTSNQAVRLNLTYTKASNILSVSHLSAGSPQGKIVFTCQIFQDADRNQICLIQADGTGWVRLSSDDHADHMYPSFSPDGESIVFSLTKGGDRQIFEMDLYGRQRQLTYLPLRAYAPAISPDNRRIVFTGNDGDGQSLWVMNRDGSNPTCLTPTIGGEAFDPVWSPDSRQILFAATIAEDTQLYVINEDGSGLQKITQLSDLRGRSDWSPDGEIVATYRGLSWQREVILLARDGEFLAQITDGGNNLAPNFSPDGQWLAFTSYRDNYRNDNGCEIYIMRIDGSQIERVTENNYCDWQPNWGP